jgi:AcrR family transcriptional regulator
MRRPRSAMIADTRAKLIAAGRLAFGATGYAEASMDAFTAEAGLTRGALYHHFGDKKGLFQAVVRQIDAEMTERLAVISAQAPTRWQGFVDEMTAYIEMALEPEIQRILFRDGPAVLGDISQWEHTSGCIQSMTATLEALRIDGVLCDIDPEAAARLLNGATSHAATWIAASDDPERTSRQAVASFRALLDGLRRPNAAASDNEPSAATPA